MSKRLTAQEQLDKAAKTLADMGVTVSITRNAAGIQSPITDELEAALGRVGILEGQSRDD